MCIILFYYRMYHFLYLLFTFITVALLTLNSVQQLINNIIDQLLSILDVNPRLIHTFNFSVYKVSLDYK